MTPMASPTSAVYPSRHNYTSRIRTSGLRDKELRRIIEACVRLAGGNAASELEGCGTVELGAGAQGVSRTHWIDQQAHQALEHDNGSEEIIRRFGGGD